MPTNRLVAKETVATYAAVALDAANEAGGLDAVLQTRDQLEVVLRALRSSVELKDLMTDPSLSSEQRSQVFANVFAGANQIVLEVLTVMADRGDVDLLGRVYAAFEEQLEQKCGVVVVDVTTAVELDDHLRQTITKKAEQDLNKKVVLRERVDQSILGGIVMSFKGRRIDASVAAKLEEARNVLKSVKDGGEC